MTQNTKRYAQFLILIVTLVFAVSVVHAQESAGISREAFYNSADGFHVLIPPGWDNQSTGAYAHFIHPQTQVSVYATAAATTDVQAGIAEALGVLQPDLAAETPQTSEIMLSNGTWTQNTYALGDSASLTAYGQEYEGSTYVVIWHSPQRAIQPVIVPGAVVEDGISAALTALGYTPDQGAATEEVTIGEQVWTRSAGEDVTVLARVRGELTHAVVASGGAVEGADALPVFFNLLTGFFLTPVTTPYLYLGLAVTTLIGLVFVGSLALRARSLRQDIKTLEALEA